jgi:hypothetical protein
MLLRDYLDIISRGYDRVAGFDTPEQDLLKRASTELSAYGPGGFVIKASGGQRPLNPTDTPWIGFFDPDESTSPMDGLYVVWLLQADRAAWTLSVNMGTERRAQELQERDRGNRRSGPREPRLRELLARESAAIRSRMLPEVTVGWDRTIDLHSGGTRQLRYEAATIIGRTYLLDSLPDDETLSRDLEAVCVGLQDAVRAKRELAVEEPGLVSTSSSTARPYDTRDPIFAPGEDRTTTVATQPRPIVRTPRHEGGLRRYGEWIIARGFKPTTNVHPRDFTILGSPEWIGEYKVVYGADVARATREAHSQLKEYRFFLYPGESPVRLLAVFSASVGQERVAWLNSEGIAVVWEERRVWRGCPFARAAGLAE